MSTAPTFFGARPSTHPSVLQIFHRAPASREVELATRAEEAEQEPTIACRGTPRKSYTHVVREDTSGGASSPKASEGLVPSPASHTQHLAQGHMGQSGKLRLSALGSKEGSFPGAFLRKNIFSQVGREAGMGVEDATIES